MQDGSQVQNQTDQLDCCTLPCPNSELSFLRAWISLSPKRTWQERLWTGPIAATTAPRHGSTLLGEQDWRGTLANLDFSTGFEHVSPCLYLTPVDRSCRNLCTVEVTVHGCRIDSALKGLSATEIDLILVFSFPFLLLVKPLQLVDDPKLRHGNARNVQALFPGVQTQSLNDFCHLHIY